jgi:hypothetical protein
LNILDHNSLDLIEAHLVAPPVVDCIVRVEHGSPSPRPFQACRRSSGGPDHIKYGMNAQCRG